MPQDTRGRLLGRRREQETLDTLLHDVREGHSRALVLRGEPGIGKTALLDYLAARAAPLRVVRAAGVEAESEFAYSAVQSLCAPLLSGLDRLPPVQQEALRVALGMSAGNPPRCSWSGWPCSACSRKRRPSLRWCAWSTTPSGSI